MIINKKKAFKLTISACIVFSMSVLLSSRVSAANSTLKRLYGIDRYATNMSIISSGWTEANNVIIASGEDFPDALCASPLAKAKAAPIMLTQKNALTSTQLDELVKLKVKNAFIIGGTGVISPNVESQLKTLGITITRFAGSDRYETSAKVAEQLTTDNGIVVASGENFPDALSIAPIAASKGMPILLSPKSNLPDSIKAYLSGKNIPVSYIIGGPGPLSSNIETSLVNPKRLFGLDRYNTNISVLKEFEGSLNFDNIFVASGNDFPDALSGSVLASNLNAPIALVDNTLSTDTSDYLKVKNIKTINMLGGTGAVSQTVETTLANTVKYLTITKVDDVSDTAFINEDYHFPPQALVTYDDSSTKLIDVKWDSNFLDTSKEGTFSFTGTVNGYNGKVSLSTKVVKETGSINGNLANRGFITYYKGNNYYCNRNDGSKIYKMTDGITQGIKLSDDSAGQLNIINDTIFYINYSDNSKVYSMKLDGSQKTKLTDIGVSSLLASDDTLYYSNDYAGIYKMNTDGTNVVKLSDGGINNIVMENGYLYFIKIGNDNSKKIYTMKSDGSEMRQISDDGATMINVENGWIYYINYNDNNSIYKVKMDGTDKTRILNKQVFTINVSNGWVYYNSFDNGGEKLFKIRTDGSNEIRLSNIDNIENIYVIGDYVFYETWDFNTRSYAEKIDGSGETRIALQFVYDNEPNNDLATSQDYNLLNNSKDAPIISGYIQNNDVDIYKINLGYSDIINVYFAAPSLGQNAVITVLDASGKELYSAQTDSSGSAGLRIDADNGTYYIKVSIKSGSTASANYNMISWNGAWQ